MLNKHIIRAMAEAERMMDEGTLPYVMAVSPNGLQERYAVPEDVMEELGLVKGQSINSMIMDAIIHENIRRLQESLDNTTQDLEDLELDSDFDFRKLMTDDN